MSEVRPEIIIRVSKDGSRLVTSENLTLYRFMPQRYDPNHGSSKGEHNYIPWMSEFPGFMKDWIETWDPVTGVPVLGEPENNKYKINGKQGGDFSTVERKGGPKMSESQIVFRGWYLYTYKNDRADGVNGEVTGLWQKVSPDLINLPDHYGSPGIKDQRVGTGP
jgi:hypothetical protein